MPRIRRKICWVVAAVVLLAVMLFWLSRWPLSSRERDLVGSWTVQKVPGNVITLHADRTFTSDGIRGSWRVSGNELVLRERGADNLSQMARQLFGRGPPLKRYTILSATAERLTLRAPRMTFALVRQRGARNVAP